MLGALAPRIDRLPFAGCVQELEDFMDDAGIAALEERYRESNERLEKGYALGLASDAAWGSGSRRCRSCAPRARRTVCR